MNKDIIFEVGRFRTKFVIDNTLRDGITVIVSVEAAKIGRGIIRDYESSGVTASNITRTLYHNAQLSLVRGMESTWEDGTDHLKCNVDTFEQIKEELVILGL